MATNTTVPAAAEATPSEPLQPHLQLQNFPQELYDQIYDIVFTANPGIRYASKPPKDASEAGRKSRPLYIKPDHVGLLHVDRLSREKFARSYYGGEGAVFVLDITLRVDLVPAWLTRWTSKVDPAHHRLIKDVRAVFAKCDIDYTEWHTRSEDYGDKDSWIVRERIPKLVALHFGQDSNVELSCQFEFEVAQDLDGFQKFGVYGVVLPAIRPHGYGYGQRRPSRRFRNTRQDYARLY